MNPLPPHLRPIHARMDALRTRLGSFQYLCSGTLQRRWMTCGRNYCNCKKDERLRHGPYYYWSHLKAGKLITQLIPSAQVQIVKQAIANYKAIKHILRLWERQTIKVLQASTDAARR